MAEETKPTEQAAAPEAPKRTMQVLNVEYGSLCGQIGNLQVRMKDLSKDTGLQLEAYQKEVDKLFNDIENLRLESVTLQNQLAEEAKKKAEEEQAKVAAAAATTPSEGNANEQKAS